MRKVESAFGTKLRLSPIGLVDIDPVEVDGRAVLYVRIQGDSSQIYTLDDRVYVRRNASSRLALSATEAAGWWARRRANRS